jgi:uncharacterized protein (TIGR03435 family)
MTNRLGSLASAFRGLLLLASAFVLPVAFAQTSSTAAQTASAGDIYVPTLTFDVAAIRQSPDAASYMVGASFAPHSSAFHATNFGIVNLLTMAYGIRWDQVSGVTDRRTMFDIQAKADSASDEKLAKLSTAQEWMEKQHMLQVLLADRFKVKAHWETREGPTYNLVIAKNGSKLNEAKGEPPDPESLKRWGDRPMPPLYQQGDSQAGFDYIGYQCSTDDLAKMLAVQFGHPVTDKTGLTAKYNFKMHYHGTRLSDRSADDLDPVPPLDTAIQDQLGLKLEPARGSSQLLVIDHIEKPSEN